MAVYEVPLTPEPQTLSVQLAGVPYTLRLGWNSVMACWLIDIMDANGALMLSAIPLITGLNLLVQYAHLGFVGGMLVVQTDYDPDAIPTYDNLGITGRLWFVTAG